MLSLKTGQANQLEGWDNSDVKSPEVMHGIRFRLDNEIRGNNIN